MANKQDVDLKFTLIDQVTKSLAGIQKSVSDVGSTLTKVNQVAELAGKAFNFAATAAASIGNAVAGAAALEDALARVGVRTNATTEQQIALQQAVESAVGATTFSAQEAAAALALLAEDGFSANDAAAQLTETLVFANAAAIDAAEATGLLGTVLDKFAASPDDISGIADALTATAAAAGASTKAIAEGLAGIGTAAKTANVSIEDSVAILGTLAVEGVESSAAVGRLNKIFQDFAEPASKFSIAIKDAGLGGLEFVEVVKALQKDSTAAAAVLATLGDKPREAMRLLLQQGGGDLAKFTQVVRDSGGAAQEAADKINSTFNAALTKLQNQFTLARDLLLTPILAPLATEFEQLGQDISEFTQSDQFPVLVASVKEFVTTTVDLLKIAGPAITDFAVISSKVLVGLVKTFNEIVEAIKFVVNTLNQLDPTGFYDLKDAAAGTSAAIDESALSAKLLANQVSNVDPVPIERLWETAQEAERRLDSTTNSVERLSGAAQNTGPLDAFGGSLSDIGRAADRSKAGSFSMVEGIEAVSDSARRSEVRNLEAEYGRLLVAAGKGADNGGELSQVRDRLQEISQSGDQAGQGAGAAKDGIDGASDAANNGRITFTSYGGEAGNVAEQSDRLAESSDRVAESLEGVADAASQSGKAFETNTALGKELTAAFLNASNSFGNYQQFFFQNLKNINDQAKVGNEQLKEAVKLAELRDPQLQREVQIRQQLLETYRVGGPELDKLVAIRVKEAEAADNEKLKQEAEQRDAVNKKVTESTKTLDEITAARERERKEREAGLAVGNQELAQNQQLVATQPKPGNTNNVTINVSLNTVPPDSREFWRRVTVDFILPELKRLERLEQ